MTENYKEIEVRFLEIDKEQLIAKLQELQAEDLGETLLRETILYDAALTWPKENKFIRIRERGGKVTVSYKHHHAATVDGTEEIEIEVNDAANARAIFERAGLIVAREQEKYRRTFLLGDVTIDIDTWPQVPTYVELEGNNEAALRTAAERLELDWSTAVTLDAMSVIEQIYHIPVKALRRFTFAGIA